MSGEHDRDCERVLTDSGFVFIDCLCHMRRVKAEAWDEGYLRAVEPDSDIRDNPYRIPSTTEGADDSLYMLRHRNRSGAWAHFVAWITRVPSTSEGEGA